jgi:hypothetical protein
MYQTIGETISVAGWYLKGHFKPVKFKWRNHTYPISETTLTSEIKDGGVRKRLFSVMAENNLYRLEFDRDLETWELSEVWFEG